MGFSMGFNRIYPLVNCHIAVERSTIFNGNIHYFYGHFQLLFVCSPEGKCSSFFKEFCCDFSVKLMIMMILGMS